jgi:hypothetical protein
LKEPHFTENNEDIYELFNDSEYEIEIIEEADPEADNVNDNTISENENPEDANIPILLIIYARYN